MGERAPAPPRRAGRRGKLRAQVGGGGRVGGERQWPRTPARSATRSRRRPRAAATTSVMSVADWPPLRTWASAEDPRDSRAPAAPRGCAARSRRWCSRPTTRWRRPRSRLAASVARTIPSATVPPRSRGVVSVRSAERTTARRGGPPARERSCVPADLTLTTHAPTAVPAVADGIVRATPQAASGFVAPPSNVSSGSYAGAGFALRIPPRRGWRVHRLSALSAAPPTSASLNQASATDHH